MPEITRKPTARQIEALRTARTNERGIVEPSADKRTHEGLVGRDLADWKSLGGKAGHFTSYCVITEKGRAFLAELDRPETGPAEVEDVTVEEIADGVEDALKWLPYGKRDEARAKGAVSVLAVEFKRAGAIMRKVLKARQGAPIETQCVVYYGKVTKLLAAARLAELRAVESVPAAPAVAVEPDVIPTPVGELLEASAYRYASPAGRHVRPYMTETMVKTGIREDGTVRRVHGMECRGCGVTGTRATLESTPCTVDDLSQGAQDAVYGAQYERMGRFETPGAVYASGELRESLRGAGLVREDGSRLMLTERGVAVAEELEARRAVERAERAAELRAVEERDREAGVISDEQLDMWAAGRSGKGPQNSVEVLRPLDPSVRLRVMDEARTFMNVTPGWNLSGAVWEAAKNVPAGRTPGKDMADVLLAHDPSGHKAAAAAANGRGWEGFTADAVAASAMGDRFAVAQGLQEVPVVPVGAAGPFAAALAEQNAAEAAVGGRVGGVEAPVAPVAPVAAPEASTGRGGGWEGGAVLEALPLNVDAGFAVGVRARLARIMSVGVAAADEVALLDLEEGVADALHLGKVDFAEHDVLLVEIRAERMRLV